MGSPHSRSSGQVTSGDYLSGFLQGTRRALWENGRQSITITLDAVTPHRVGALIALFERAVGLYAGLVGINAYDQPGGRGRQEGGRGSPGVATARCGLPGGSGWPRTRTRPRRTPSRPTLARG